MTGGLQIILIALSLAFCWVEVFKIGKVKPFNCIKCMTGWFSLILATAFQIPFYPFYLFIGLFTGAMFEALKLRYL